LKQHALAAVTAAALVTFSLSLTLSAQSQTEKTKEPTKVYAYKEVAPHIRRTRRAWRRDRK
jgi:hypothetical protein